MKEQISFTPESEKSANDYLRVIQTLLETGTSHVLSVFNKLVFAKKDEHGHTKEERRVIEEMEKHNHFKTPKVTRPITI